jgi:hypothetical protein
VGVWITGGWEKRRDVERRVEMWTYEERRGEKRREG